ncbi:Uncharacterised protein [Mycobacteroides abscessus subsp. abscessus]|nr:Uncharacterised protein [Mycobacteroides abscessus subsp. abscessus]
MSTGEGYPMSEESRNRWDRPAVVVGWILLVASTALSAYMNADYARRTESTVWFHAGIPVVVLLLGIVVEFAFLSSAHRVAKAITVAGLGACFVIVLIASYLAVLAVTEALNPAAPGWVNAGLAAIPDVAMVMAVTLIMSLRVRHRRAPAASTKPAAAGNWRMIGNAATGALVSFAGRHTNHQVTAVEEVRGAAVEPAVEVQPPAVEPSTEPSTEDQPTTVEPSVKTATEVKPPSVKTSTKPAVEVADPELLPFMEAAETMVADGVVARKSAREIAEVIAAIEQRKSPNRIKTELGFSSGTTAKITAAWREMEPEPTLSAVG